MTGDAGPSQPDLNLLQTDDDLDGLADVPVWHAVANRVDIDEAVGTHATRQAMGPDRQRTDRQGSQRLPFVTLETDHRLFAGGSVNPLIGDLDEPPGQVSSEGLERRERPPGQGVVLDVADSSLDLSLGPGSSRTAGSRRDPAVLTERLEARIPDDGAGPGVVRIDQRRGVVAEDLQGNPLEMAAGGLDSFEPIVLPLRQKRLAKEPSRVAQDDGHELDGDGLVGDRDDFFTEVDLHLLTGRGLEPDGGQSLGPDGLSERSDGALQGPEFDVDALSGEFLLDDDGVAFGDGLEEPLDLFLGGGIETTSGRTLLVADGGPGEITADGIAGDPDLASDPFAAQTLSSEFADEVHEIRLEHASVLLRFSQVDLVDIRRSDLLMMQVDQKHLGLVHNATSTNVEEGGQFYCRQGGQFYCRLTFVS